MKNKESKTVIVYTELSAEQIKEKLSSITIKEFKDAVINPEYKYYGTISNSEFDIRNKKYGQYSNGPSLKGKIDEKDHKVILIIEMDTEEQIKVLRRMTYPIMIFFGVFVIIFGLLLNEIRMYSFLIGISIIALAFIQTNSIKLLLKSMQQKEMNEFISLINN